MHQPNHASVSIEDLKLDDFDVRNNKFVLSCCISDLNAPELLHPASKATAFKSSNQSTLLSIKLQYTTNYSSTFAWLSSLKKIVCNKRPDHPTNKSIKKKKFQSVYGGNDRATMFLLEAVTPSQRACV